MSIYHEYTFYSSAMNETRNVWDERRVLLSVNMVATVAQAIRNLPHGNSFGYSRHTVGILLMQKPNNRHTPLPAYFSTYGQDTDKAGLNTGHNLYAALSANYYLLNKAA